MAATSPDITAVPEHDWVWNIAPGLSIAATCDAASPLIGDFFQGYDRAFVLKDEKEPLSGFKACLALNHGAAYGKLAGQFGAFREIVLVARDASGARVGGANFISFPAGAKGAPPCICANLNYIYVERNARGKGYLKALLAGITGFIPRLFEPQPAHVLVFIEQNDPFRMDDEAYARDTRHAGIDQFDRLSIWLHEGARIIDFDYIQPPLGPGQPPDETLVYAVLDPPGATLSACLLREHLMRFFAISVLKGGNLDHDPSAVKQLKTLAEKCAKGTPIDLLDMPSSVVERAKQARAPRSGRGADLRAFIRGETGK